MMMTQVMDQKRRSSGFLHLKCEGEHGGGDGMESKRLKTGGCGRGSISVRERKDKVGEKISALQQLVSPFGKTDTASVLQEATGYIKFLHEQLEVLSAPYLKNPSTSTLGSQQMSEHRNLRSRGLCLVPVSYSLQLSGNNGADIWAPVNMKKP